MIDELELLTRIGTDVPPLSPTAKARIQARLAARAANPPTHTHRPSPATAPDPTPALDARLARDADAGLGNEGVLDAERALDAGAGLDAGAAVGGGARVDVGASMEAERALEGAGGGVGSGDELGRARGRRRVVRGVLAVGAVAAAAVGAAIALPVGHSTPAYALDTGPDGTVDVRISDFTQPERLQADLRKAGIPAYVDYLPMGQTCSQARGRTAPIGPGVVSGTLSSDHKTALRISRKGLRPGQSVVFMAMLAGNDTSQAGMMSLSVVQGPVAPCKPAKSSDAPGMSVQPIPPGGQDGGTPARP